jgi:hypothetical protein
MKDISSLDPRMQPLVHRLIEHATAQGLETVVIEARRELCTQIAYWLRSRAPVATVKAVFARLGLWAITDAEAATANTKTLYSKHLDGLAVDIAVARNGKPWWDAPREVWEKLWRIAEDECGLDACAAGKWQAWNWDWPHIEYRDGVLDDFRHKEGIA